jgi:hypothetical protein
MHVVSENESALASRLFAEYRRSSDRRLLLAHLDRDTFNTRQAHRDINVVLG